MADRDLPAIGEARLKPRRRLAIDHADALAGAHMPIGGVDADHAGAKHDDIEIVDLLIISS